MDLQRLKADVKAMDFDFGHFTVERFADWVAERHGRPIRLQPWSKMPAGVSGLWLSTGAVEYIYYLDSLPPLLKTVTLLHELAHILLGHQTLVVTDSSQEFLANLRDQAEGVVQRAMFYNTAEDHEAEHLALLILKRALDQHGAEFPPNSPGAEYLNILRVL